MDQIAAFDATVELAQARGMPRFEGTQVGLDHLLLMRVRISPEFDQGKLGRWLGWAQCAVVASGVATMDEFRELNASFLRSNTSLPQEKA